MNRKEAERQTRQADALRALGFTRDEAEKLRRISMTLHRWHEQECGDSNAYGSWAIERDGDEPDSKPYRVYWPNSAARPTRTPIADKETGAHKRLAAIIARRNAEHAERGLVSTYVQGDPRGVALYIIRPGDIPEGSSVESSYSRGLAVY